MTSNLRFTLSTHGVIELALGLLTLISPALLNFGPGGIVAGVLLGSLLVGMGVSVGTDQPAAPAWHQLLDLIVVLATALAALAMALAGEAPAALFFVALTVLCAGVNVTTRYVATA